MKPIRSLCGLTTGLKEYLAVDGDQAEWHRFHDYNGSAAYEELRNELVSLQHGLCGYCEINLLVGLDCQIEHVIPRSDPSTGAANTFNVVNLVACCEGGTKARIFGEPRSKDPVRFLEPAEANTSCGQRKKDDTIPDFVDPRNLPVSSSIFRVGLNGDIEANEDACNQFDISVESARNTITLLGLNVPRLRRARENYYNALEDDSDGHLDIPEAIIEEARRTLLPDDAGTLRKFFTTSRTYFGEMGESVLSRTPQSWI